MTATMEQTSESFSIGGRTENTHKSNHHAGPDERKDGMSEGESDYEMTVEQLAAADALRRLQSDITAADEDDDEDIDDFGGPEYDVRERLKEINATLNNEPEPDANRRRSVGFRANLVDVAPPSPRSNGYSDDDDFEDIDNGIKNGAGDSPKSRQPVEEKLDRLNLTSSGDSYDSPDGKIGKEKNTVNTSQGSGDKGKGSDQDRGSDETVLVEVNGKYQLVPVKDLESLGLAGLVPAVSSPPRNDRAKTNSEERHRPSTATARRDSAESRESIRPQRAQSATTTRTTPSSGRGNAQSQNLFQLWNEPTYSSKYGLSPEQQRIKKQREEAIRERERLECERQRQEQERKREENESAFQHWLETKRKEAAERKRDGDKRSDEEEENRKMRESAFQEWVKHKREQQKKDKLLSRREQQERDDGFFLRSREECEKAFKEWIRKKNAAMKKAKEAEMAKLRASRYYKKTKKNKKIIRAMKESKSTKKVDYYPHAF